MKRQKAPAFTTANKIYVGIDNGVSGTIGWSGYENGNHIYGQIKTPIFSEQSYTKTKGNISRIDFRELKCFFENMIKKNQLSVFLERPMVNPTRFQASMSALRALESTLVILEILDIPRQYIDSKEWQKVMLPSGLKGTDQLKKASLSIGKRLFPNISCKPDADGILIAEYARRKQL